MLAPVENESRSDYEDRTTTQLLDRWHEGDRAALDVLLERHQAWIHERASKRLGDALRAKLDSLDIVQTALLKFCADGPRIRINDEPHFRRLMAIIVENTIRDTNDYFTRRRRDLRREQELASTTVLDFDARRRRAPSPDQALANAERQALLRLGLECLRPVDREVLLARTRDGLAFAEIAQRLRITPAAADARFRRAARKLQRAMELVRGGDIAQLVDEFEG